MQKHVNKKGQFYIFTAIILSTYLFSLASVYTQAQNNIDNFQSIKDNFVKEAPVAINSAVYNRTNVSQNLLNFKDSFKSYARTKGVELEILYLLSENNDVKINNFLNDNIIVNTNTVVNASTITTITKTENITVKLNNITYNFKLNDEELQFKALLKSVDGQNIRIYKHD